MLAGGVRYTPGALACHRPGPWRITAAGQAPARRFGYHEVFHTFARAAAPRQYLAIALFIV